MRTLLITGLALGMTGGAMPAEAVSTTAPLAMMQQGAAMPGAGPVASRHAGPQAGPSHRWGPRVNGRWYAGSRAPGGWAAYRRPVYGWTLPRYWIEPSFYIANYAAYGLPAPRPGFGWSRYYDDAVMTDQYGRVYDSRSDIDWDRNEGGYAQDASPVESPPAAVAQARPAPPPAPLPPEARSTPMPPPPAHDYAMRSHDDGVTYDGGTVGARHHPGVGYDMPPPGPPPRREDGHGRHHHPDSSEPMVTTYSEPGYYADGYYYPGATVTTVVVQPAVTTTVEEISYVTRPARRTWKRAKCHCK